MNQPDNDILFAIVLILIFAALGCFLITLTRNHYQNRYEQMKLFLVALGLRFAASIVVYEFGLARVLGDEDSGGFYRGVVLAYEWGKQRIGVFELPGAMAAAFQGHHEGYYHLIAALFYLTDSPSRLPAAALNCFFGALTVVFAYRIARSLFSQWAATRVGWLTCVFPSMIIWSAQTLKEPVVIFLETVALYACVHLKISGFTVRYILLCAFSVLLLYPFRFYAAFLAATAAALTLILPQIGKGKSSIKSAIAVAILVIPLAVSSGMLARSEAEFERFDLEKIQKFRDNVSEGQGSGVRTGYDIRTTSGLIAGTAIGAAHLLLAPFPWQLGGGSVRMLLTMPELLAWWWLVFAGLGFGIWYAVRNKLMEAMPMLVFIVGLGLLYSMMFGNVGLIFRQRAQLLPWLLIFAVVGLEQRAIKKLLKSRMSVRPTGLAQARQ
jgi:hypothetical protein